MNRQLVFSLWQTRQQLAQGEGVLVVRSCVLLVAVQRSGGPTLDGRSVLVATSWVEVIVHDGRTVVLWIVLRSISATHLHSHRHGIEVGDCLFHLCVVIRFLVVSILCLSQQFLCFGKGRCSGRCTAFDGIGKRLDSHSKVSVERCTCLHSLHRSLQIHQTSVCIVGILCVGNGIRKRIQFRLSSIVLQQALSVWYCLSNDLSQHFGILSAERERSSTSPKAAVLHGTHLVGHAQTHRAISDKTIDRNWELAFVEGSRSLVALVDGHHTLDVARRNLCFV